MKGSGSPAPSDPRRVVALGGGTGLPVVLRGLRSLLQQGRIEEVTAVVTMTDDGGSSGRLRRSHGVPPPGDLRNCLVALAAHEDQMAKLFQHRYLGTEGIGGHTVGNLILAALAQQTGCFLEAVELSSRVLGVVGRILPATLEGVTLEATMGDGSTIAGETSIAASPLGIRELRLAPGRPQATPGVTQAIHDADIVVLGPGSLYTSVVPNLLVDGVAQALRDTRAVVVMVGNVVSEPGENPGRHLDDHLRVLEQHAGFPLVDAILVHEGPIDADLLERYKAEGATPLGWKGTTNRPRVHARNLVGRGGKIRHDPTRTVDELIAAWRDVVASRSIQNAG